MVDNGKLAQAHKTSMHNRETLAKSDSCGCFYCLRIYPPGEIKEWADAVDGKGTTAICPHCSVDSILASAPGYPVTAEFLKAMRKEYFEKFYSIKEL